MQHTCVSIVLVGIQCAQCNAMTQSYSSMLLNRAHVYSMQRNDSIMLKWVQCNDSIVFNATRMRLNRAQSYSMQHACHSIVLNRIQCNTHAKSYSMQHTCDSIVLAGIQCNAMTQSCSIVFNSTRMRLNRASGYSMQCNDSIVGINRPRAYTLTMYL